MQTVKIYQLDHLSQKQFQRLKAAQMEAAQVWDACMEMHKQARLTHEKWPGRNELQKATKGRFALYSQSIQKATRQVINFCVEQLVGTLFIGNPDGVRRCILFSTPIAKYEKL